MKNRIKNKLLNKKTILIIVLFILIILLGLFLLLRNDRKEDVENFEDFMGFGNSNEPLSSIEEENQTEVIYQDSTVEDHSDEQHDDGHSALPEAKPYGISYVSPNNEREFFLSVENDKATLTITGTNIEIQNVANAKWSLDSQYILFSKQENGLDGGHNDMLDSGNLNVIRYDGVGEKELFNSDIMNGVDYMSNGEKVVFATINEIYKVDIDGSNLEKIGEFEPYWAQFGLIATPSVRIENNIGIIDLSDIPSESRVVEVSLD